MRNFKSYILNNTLKGFTAKPRFCSKRVIIPTAFFIVIAFGYGYVSGLLEIKLIRSNFILILPFTLFVFPALLEEIVFRGLLIPIDTKNKDELQIVKYIAISTIAFVLWHPLNALTINQGAQLYFLDGRFLFITTILGITCSYTYIYTKSIWIPVTIHWLTVIVWVFLLGGRNLVLEQTAMHNQALQLTAGSTAFLNNAGKGLKIEKNAIRLSKIFDWFGDDFKVSGGVMAFIVSSWEG
jgi:membrane protease YdiL (CAAX protease family)